MSDVDDTATAPAMALEGAFAERDAWTAEGWCRMEGALEVVGTRSAMVLLREAFYGARRFDDLARRTGLSDAVAAGRLKELVAHGLLDRRPYQQPGARTRHEYVLTERGARMFPVFVALMEWGDSLREDDRTAVDLEHAGCGSRLHAEVRCAEGHVVELDDAVVRLRDEEWAVKARARTAR